MNTKNSITQVNQILQIKDTTHRDELSTILSLNTNKDLSGYGEEELAMIVAYSVNDDLVNEARKILRRTERNAKVPYRAWENNMSLLQEQQEDEESERGIVKHHNQKLKELKEDFYCNIEALKATKKKQGSISNLKNAINLKKEIKEQARMVKEWTTQSIGLYHSIQLGR